MDMKEKLKKICRQMNIEHIGIAPIGPYKELEQILRNRIQKGEITEFEEKDIEKRIDPKKTMQNVKSIIVGLFPYFTGHGDHSNIAKYAYMKDYHRIIKDKLEKIGMYLQKEIKDFSFQVYVDTGPLVDRYLAYLAGLGFYGLNHQLITDAYGSYVLIGYILNNYPFIPDTPLKRTCMQCEACLKACPGGAIQKGYGMDPKKCLSYITQKKEDLSPKEVDIIKKSKMVFGCDICQDVCPYNQNVKITPIEDFQKELIMKIDRKSILGLSNRAFKKQYGDRAFSWRGKKVLQRNLEILRS